MITEDQIIAYFSHLASVHKVLEHGVDGKVSFFNVEDPDDLANFDEALRNMSSQLAFLVCASEGELEDNGSENYVQTLDLQIFVLKTTSSGLSIPAIRSECMDVLQGILGRVRNQSRTLGAIVPGKKINFLINDIPVKKVGPMFMEWYGYTAMLRFTCPFGYSVDSGTWTDI